MPVHWTPPNPPTTQKNLNQLAEAFQQALDEVQEVCDVPLADTLESCLLYTSDAADE